MKRQLHFLGFYERPRPFRLVFGAFLIVIVMSLVARAQTAPTFAAAESATVDQPDRRLGRRGESLAATGAVTILNISEPAAGETAYFRIRLVEE